MIFEPGKSYWTLDEDQYEELLTLLEALELDYDIANDFELVGDMYYLDMESSKISDEELNFFSKYLMPGRFDYKLSTQSTSPFGD